MDTRGEVATLERWHDASMNADLDPVVASLAALDDRERGAMIAMLDDGPELVPACSPGSSMID